MASKPENKPVEFEDDLDHPRKKKHSVLQIVVLILIIIMFCYLGFEAWYISSCFKPMSDKSESVVFTVEEGSSLEEVSYDLQDAGLIKSGKIGYYYAKFEGLTDIKAGGFALDKNWSMKQLYGTLVDPDASNADNLSVSIIPGDWTKHAAESIASSMGYDKNELLALWNDQNYIRSLMPKYPFLTEDMFADGVRCYLEGYFAPDTYLFKKGASMQQVTEQMLDQTLKVYDQYADKFSSSELSIHQIFTLASIIQYEGTGEMEVLKNISSVFYNRLHADMTLGSSVTVCYALDYDRDTDNWQSCEVNIDIDSPYNTYKHTGLPPGAITTFSKDALEAALEPNTTDYYYFMADVYGDGTVYFSKTIEEHDALVQKYLQK